MKYFRLLPAVIVVGVAVLGLKGEGLINGALAQAQNASGPNQSLARDTAPLSSDPATADNHGESPAEVDVLSSLARRRTELDTRQADIDMRTQVLAAAEARVDAKITTLKQLQDQINTLLGQRDTEQQRQVTNLVKTYSAMKPKDAARIFNTLSDDVLIPVAQAMKSDVLAPILAAMNSDAAQRLTQKLANRLRLPETADAAAPAAPAAATPAPPAPGRTAAAAPAAPAARPGSQAGRQ
jgi:flagellar motility protein MotE (MotC chaperone)